MRLSSPALAAAFIDGATAQGADVVDYGMIPTDMLYFAVARDGHDGGVEITASHNPKQYNGLKMVEKEARPLSGDAGISDIRDMIAGNRVPAPAARRGQVTQADALDRYVDHVMSFIDPSLVKPFNVVLDAGSGMGGLVAPKLFERLPCRTTSLCFEIDGRFPNHEVEPADRRKPPRHRRGGHRGRRPTSASRGTATPTAASSSTGSGEFVSGDFVTALLAEAFLLRHPGASVVYDLRASHAVRDTVARYGGTALMNRVGHAFIKQRMRESDSIFGGEVTGHYYFRDNFFCRQRLHPGAADARADVEEGPEPAAAARAASREIFHLRRDQHQARGDGRRAGDARTASPPAMATAGRPRWTACRSSTPTGTSTCGPRTPSRCCG